LKLARAGAVILPPSPGFYDHPGTVADLVDFVVARVLDQLHVPHALGPRWGERRVADPIPGTRQA
jgi:4-hydroxy-3-polyprenylbenzoate decarboxylase